ncbi:hypothetical protein EYM_02180 [Ignicoccus islandicus DSM 13165]|uniref:Uncharacterized protein n=1 Tax=Ignicoccus islandicus DSM 13165 TaxID=940295 RepID=A0A0U3FQW6_9CREN|nr:hypothetical protein [Ignicoccus islandicus]ALU12295.1 hypothetical protein EYM_02180 [Ignicoccus islandicus DSM 13165]
MSNSSKSGLYKLNELLEITLKKDAKESVEVKDVINELMNELIYKKIQTGKNKSGNNNELDLCSFSSNEKARELIRKVTEAICIKIKNKLRDVDQNVAKAFEINRCVNELVGLIENYGTSNGDCKTVQGLLSSLKEMHEKISEMKGEDLLKRILGKDIDEDKKKNELVKAIKNTLKDLIYMLDTCYGDNKASNFASALNNVKGKLNTQFCKFLSLAAAVTYLKATGKLKDRSEWFYEVVRAALSSDNNNFKFPYCPWLGDAMALIYSYLFCCECNTRDQIDAGTIMDILAKLLGADQDQKSK